MMREKLISEIKKTAHKILNMQGEADIVALKNEVRALYEELTALVFIETHSGKSDAVKKFEELAASVITENTQVPESNPHEEDLVEPVMYKIKDLVAEMFREETLDDILSDVKPNPTFIKKEENGSIPQPVSEEKNSEARKRSLNDILNKNIPIGLNDRIGFVKHLFNGSSDDFDKVILQLNALINRDEAIGFINNTVKPKYNNWEDKEDYEARFLALIEAKFDA